MVWVTEEELAKMAEVRGESIEEIRKNHTRLVGKRVSLTERPNGDCTFFDPQTRHCTVYGAAPRNAARGRFGTRTSRAAKTGR